MSGWCRALLVAPAMLMVAACSGGSGSPAVRSPAVSPAPVPSYITSAQWSHPSEGYRLHVKPSTYGRNHALDDPARAFAEAVSAAGHAPLRITSRIRASMTNQLRCHAEFAPTKPRWDVESWRPDVSYDATVVALCNP